jgi:hypothetical protein
MEKEFIVTFPVNIKFLEWDMDFDVTCVLKFQFEYTSTTKIDMIPAGMKSKTIIQKKT